MKNGIITKIQYGYAYVYECGYTKERNVRIDHYCVKNRHVRMYQWRS